MLLMNGELNLSTANILHNALISGDLILATDDK